MRGMKTLGLLASASFLAALAGAAAAEDIVLGYMPASMEYPFNVATQKGFVEEAESLGAKVVTIDPQGSVEKQANGVDDFLSQGVDGIGMLPLDGVVAQEWVEKSVAAGVPFVSLATMVGDPATRAWNDVYPNLTALVGMDNVGAGRASGELAAEMLPKDRVVKIAIIEGAPGYPQVGQRTQGFREGLDAAGIQYEIVASQPTDWTPEKGEAVCLNILTATPDLDMFFSQADDMAIGCARAIEAAGSQAALIATGGGSSTGLAAVENGEIDGSVCDRPEHAGRLVARALFEAVTGKKTDKAQLITFETPKITKDTLAECPPEW